MHLAAPAFAPPLWRLSRMTAPARRTRSATAAAASPPLPKRVRTAGIADRVLAAEKAASHALGELTFKSPVTHVYDPLVYAWDAHEWFVRSFGDSTKRVLFIAMNPGPWGMGQHGIPLGEISSVLNWMRIPRDVHIGKPLSEHPKRPVLGLRTTRSEVSGRRFWKEWAQAEYGDDPADFFRTFYVRNYCPLMFLETTGRNRTPVQLPAKERAAILAICDKALVEVVDVLKPALVCGIGGFAADRCKSALAQQIDNGLRVGTVLHPSPASPAANRGWVEQAKKQLSDLMEDLDG